MKYGAVFCLLGALMLLPSPTILADDDDTAELEDIDAGAKEETSDDNEIMHNANGPGEPQQEGTSSVYDGYPYTSSGYPYGYAYPFGYGYGYLYGGYYGGYGYRGPVGGPGQAGGGRR